MKININTKLQRACALFMLFAIGLFLKKAAYAQVTIYLPLIGNGQATSQPTEVVHYLFNEELGITSFEDASPNNVDAVCLSSDACPASAAFGKLGTFVEFDGIDDALQVSDLGLLNVTDDFTIEMWIFPTSKNCGFCRLVNKYGGNKGFSLDMADNAGNTRLTMYLSDGQNSVTIRSATNLLLNQWHHIVAVVSSQEEQVHLYVDGNETIYLTPTSSAAVGQIGSMADLYIGKLAGELLGYQGAMAELILYQGKLSDSNVIEHFNQRNPNNDDLLAHWNSHQMATVLDGFGVHLNSQSNFSETAYGTTPKVANEAAHAISPTTSCPTCSITIFSFANQQDLEQTKQYFQRTETTVADVAAQPWLYVRDNLLVVLDSAFSAQEATIVGDAIRLGSLKSLLDTPPNVADTDFESWAAYYPTDRGQQRDKQNGRSQRTFDRWDTDNQWLYGQSTWLFQDPDQTDAPPTAMPTSYNGHQLAYYYHFHCEQEVTPTKSQDCLNWQIYIELLTAGVDETELANWARGGWQRLAQSPVQWEVFYKPDAFDGNCDKSYIQANFNDAYLQDATNKAPLLFRLPSHPGAWAGTPEVCAIVFSSYDYRVNDIQKANFWRVTTTTHQKDFENDTQRFLIKAENRYYEYLATTQGDVVYKQWAGEIYWTRQTKPDALLQNGLASFWWWTWQTPPEDNMDKDQDQTWSNLQWCRLDRSQGPTGLGMLICEP